MLQRTVQWFFEGVPLRLNSPEKSAIIVIMQRIDMTDVSGAILDRRLGYDHICLPMRFDPTRRIATKLGYVDIREEPGELLFPERFPLSVVERDENVLGKFATAGQFQQLPVPRGGGIIQVDWWQMWAEDNFPPLDYIIAYLDTAYTAKEQNDPSALTIFGVFTSSTKAQITQTITRGGLMEKIERVYAEGSPNAVLMHAFSEHLEFHELVEKVGKVCRDKRVDKVLIENKAAGISIAQEMRRVFRDEDFVVQLDDPYGLDKTARLNSVEQMFKEGMVWAPDKQWAREVIDQVGDFPRGAHDDLVDCVSGTLRYLRRTGMLTRSTERLADIEASRIYQKPQAPLYPA
jgi:predicted phage terminase large subunit-like protein